MKDLYETMYESCFYVLFGQSSSFTAFLMVRSSAVMPLYTDKKDSCQWKRPYTQANRNKIRQRETAIDFDRTLTLSCKSIRA